MYANLGVHFVHTLVDIFSWWDPHEPYHKKSCFWCMQISMTQNSFCTLWSGQPAQLLGSAMNIYLYSYFLYPVIISYIMFIIFKDEWNGPREIIVTWNHLLAAKILPFKSWPVRRDSSCWSLFVLRFYGPVNPMGSCRARSVYWAGLVL